MAVATPPASRTSAAAPGSTDQWSAVSPRPAQALLLALIALAAYAAFASGATDMPQATWLQVGLMVVAGAGCAAWLFGGSLTIASSTAGWTGVGLLVGFAAWTGVTITHSIAPDQSWSELNRGIAYVLVLLCAMGVGSSLPDGLRRLADAYGLLAIAVALFALGGKVAPGLHVGSLIDLDHAGEVSRLRAPLDYWNALGLFVAFAIPLYLHDAADPRRSPRRRLGALAALLLLGTVLGLTYSRGGVLALAAAIALLLAFHPHRFRALALLAVTGTATTIGLVFAFARDDLTTDGLEVAQRADDGRLLGLVLLLALGLTLAGGWLVLRHENRFAWTAERSRRARALGLRAFVAVGAVLAIGFVATKGAEPLRDRFVRTEKDETTDPSRLMSTNSGNRWTWWKEAIGAWSDAPVRGRGAASFPMLHLQYRKDRLPVQQPHSVPLQFLAETGLIGLLLAAGGALALLAAALARVRANPTERALAAAVLAVPVAYLIHASFDWDWDVPGATVPAFLFCGVLIGRPPGGRPRRAIGDGRGVALAAAIALLCGGVVSAALPAISESMAEGALRDLPDRPSPQDLQDAAQRAELARKLNPTSVAPLLASASIAERRGSPDQARRFLLGAAEKQPDNVRVWYRLIRIELVRNDRAGMQRAALRALELDPNSPLARQYVQRALAFATPPNESPTATGTPLPQSVSAGPPGTTPAPPGPGRPPTPGRPRPGERTPTTPRQESPRPPRDRAPRDTGNRRPRDQAPPGDTGNPAPPGDDEPPGVPGTPPPAVPTPSPSPQATPPPG